jgi:hypothetical protein
MTSNKQQIKERMMQSAAKFWGVPETDTDASFDPLVGLLMGACSTELEKINDEIENSRSRVLERLVQLLSPEALTGVLPAHAIACAMPSEQIGQTKVDDQFYNSKKILIPEAVDKNKQHEIYFSPLGKFKLHKAVIKYKAVGNKMELMDSSRNIAQPIFSNNNALPVNEIWLGIETKQFNLNDLHFYFEVAQQSQKKLFFNQLPKATWHAQDEQITCKSGYNYKQNNDNYFDLDSVLNRDISATEKSDKHIHQFYQHQFITLKDENNIAANAYDLIKDNRKLTEVFSEKEMAQIQSKTLYWICIKFPESVNRTTVEELAIHLNCFPVVNRHLNDINFRIKEFINIIPLQSEETFLDIYTIADQKGKQLHLRKNENDEDDFSILLRHGGVSRFDKREAAEMVDKLIQLLREETAAFSILGNDFLQNEMTSLQQTLNKLEQQITNKQLLKGETPYLVINNKQADTRQTVYVKFWSSNGENANLIKAATPLSVYSSSHYESGTARLITTTQGGRNKLNDAEKVLAYKSALLSKQKLVTNEDIGAFCRLRLSIADAVVHIKKGFSVEADSVHGLSRTLDITILLSSYNYTSLLAKGDIQFWQSDIEVAIIQHSNFFIPVRVFIKDQSKL